MTNIYRRLFTKTLVFSTLFLIFAGGMVTSTGSGLAVPDWPLSYGTLFPPMVGGVFYEHGHRMIATLIGFMTLVLAAWLGFTEKRKWVKVLGYVALGAVIVQGVLGGITVLFFLPTAVSMSHGMLAQTFLLMTILLAYSQSVERQRRQTERVGFDKTLTMWAIIFIALMYLQLFLGALMRHTESGLAIYDFPTMAGAWWPMFNQEMLDTINWWRFDHDLDPVTMPQVVYHFLHRAGAVLVIIGLTILNMKCFQTSLPQKKMIIKAVMWVNTFMGVQIILGILTVLTGKEPWTTSVHVVNGAAILGLAFFAFLRIAPLSTKDFRL